MRLYATVLLVAWCTVSLFGCSGGHRKSCMSKNRDKHKECVDEDDWDDDDDHDDHDRCDCPCDGGHAMPGGYMPSYDSGCGCQGSMPSYFESGIPLSYPGMPQSSGCGCGSNGGMMMSPQMPMYNNQQMPTYNNQSMMMMQPMPDASPTPTPAHAPLAPPASSVPPTTEYYSPRSVTPTSSVPAAF